MYGLYSICLLCGYQSSGRPSFFLSYRVSPTYLSTQVALLSTGPIPFSRASPRSVVSRVLSHSVIWGVSESSVKSALGRNMRSLYFPGIRTGFNQECFRKIRMAPVKIVLGRRGFEAGGFLLSYLASVRGVSGRLWWNRSFPRAFPDSTQECIRREQVKPVYPYCTVRFLSGMLWGHPGDCNQGCLREKLLKPVCSWHVEWFPSRVF